MKCTILIHLVAINILKNLQSVYLERCHFTSEIFKTRHSSHQVFLSEHCSYFEEKIGNVNN